MGTAMPDTEASYTPPPTHFNRKPERKAYPRTTARDDSKGRESGHSCTRHRGIIHSTEREGGGTGTAVPDSTQPPATHLQRNDDSYHGCCWQGFVREKARLRQQ